MGRPPSAQVLGPATPRRASTARLAGKLFRILEGGAACRGRLCVKGKRAGKLDLLVEPLKQKEEACWAAQNVVAPWRPDYCERVGTNPANRDGSEPMSAVGTPGKTCNAN